MADEEDRGGVVAAEPAQQVHDLPLHGDVQGCRRLVRDDEVGAQHRGGGDRHPLALASGELEGAGAQQAALAGQRDAAELDQGLFDGLVPRGSVVCAHGLRQLRLDPERRVEGGGGVLEDHRHSGRQLPVPFPARQRPDVRAEEPVGVPGRAGAVGQQVGEGERGQGLAGTGLADQADHLTAPQREADAAHGPDHPVPGGQGDPQVLHLQYVVR